MTSRLYSKDFRSSFVIYSSIVIFSLALVINPIVYKYILGIANGWSLYTGMYDLIAGIVLVSGLLFLKIRSGLYYFLHIFLLICLLPAMFAVEILITNHLFNLTLERLAKSAEPGVSTEDAGLYRPDDLAGWIPIPDTKQLHEKYEVYYEFDSHGRKRIPQNPSVQTTLHVFGDSFVFGEGVPNEQTALNLLSDMTRESINVQNYAVGGYGFEQMAARLLQSSREIKEGDTVVFAPIFHDVVRSLIDPRFVCGLYYPQAGPFRGIARYPALIGNRLLTRELNEECDFVLDFLLAKSPRYFGIIYNKYQDSVRRPYLVQNTNQVLAFAKSRAEKLGARFILIFVATPQECELGQHFLEMSQIEQPHETLLEYCQGNAEELAIALQTDNHWSLEGNEWAADSLFKLLLKLEVIS